MTKNNKVKLNSGRKKMFYTCQIREIRRENSATKILLLHTSTSLPDEPLGFTWVSRDGCRDNGPWSRGWGLISVTRIIYQLTRTSDLTRSFVRKGAYTNRHRELEGKQSGLTLITDMQTLLCNARDVPRSALTSAPIGRVHCSINYVYVKPYFKKL